MIDAFLTSPDDLPPLSCCRSSRRRLADVHALNVAPRPEPDPKTSSSVTGIGLAASVVLVVSMIALPSFSADDASSGTPNGAHRTL